MELALARLREDGYLDDERYARLYVEDKRGLEQWGAERIRRDLTARGVDRELVEAALGAGAPESELHRALALLRRRFPVAPDDRRERERALRMLLRKGYDYEVARQALASAFASRSAGSE